MESRSEQDQSEGPVRTPLPRLFAVFFRLGALSWGGGSTLSVMMMEEFIQRQSWMSFTQYASLAGISRISPGMNLVALTILVGLRQSGPAGVPVALLGLTLPSLLVIGVLCGLVRSSARSPMVLGAMQGVNGVVVGLLLAAGWRTLEELRREAPDRFVVCLAIVGVSLAASLLLAWGPVQVLLLAAGISMMPVWLRSRRDE